MTLPCHINCFTSNKTHRFFFFSTSTFAILSIRCYQIDPRHMKVDKVFADWNVVIYRMVRILQEFWWRKKKKRKKKFFLGYHFFFSLSLWKDQLKDTNLNAVKEQKQQRHRQQWQQTSGRSLNFSLLFPWTITCDQWLLHRSNQDICFMQITQKRKKRFFFFSL